MSTRLGNIGTTKLVRATNLLELLLLHTQEPSRRRAYSAALEIGCRELLARQNAPRTVEQATPFDR